MNDLAELKQLRRIAKAARRLLNLLAHGHGVPRTKPYCTASDVLDDALTEWEISQAGAEPTGALDHFNQS